MDPEPEPESYSVTIVKRPLLDRLRYYLVKLEEQEIEARRPALLVQEAFKTLDEIEEAVRKLVEPHRL